MKYVLIAKKEGQFFIGFVMDHGCHEIDGESGSHRLDMPEDLNITHLYKIYEKTTAYKSLADYKV